MYALDCIDIVVDIIDVKKKVHSMLHASVH